MPYGLRNTGGWVYYVCQPAFVTYQVIVLRDQVHLQFGDFNLVHLEVRAVLKCLLLYTVCKNWSFRNTSFWLRVSCKMQRKLSKVGEMISLSYFSGICEQSGIKKVKDQSNFWDIVYFRFVCNKASGFWLNVLFKFILSRTAGVCFLWWWRHCIIHICVCPDPPSVF